MQTKDTSPKGSGGDNGTGKKMMGKGGYASWYASGTVANSKNYMFLGENHIRGVIQRKKRAPNENTASAMKLQTKGPTNASWGKLEGEGGN